YGMIANIDENMGRLEDFLVKNGLKDNTIVIFSSDNGSRSPEATMIWNGGMRGHKQELWDGGHRVHCYFRWPQAGFKTGRDVNVLTEVQDIAPTLLELCNIKPANLYPMDGVSLVGLLRDEVWPHADRKLVIQYRNSCKPWDNAAVASEKWRVLKEKDNLTLCDLAKDPHQDRNVAGQFGKVLQDLSRFYDGWHKVAYAEFLKIRYIHLGDPGVPEVDLYANDWNGDYCDWKDNLIAGKAVGSWDIEVETPGEYKVELSRWPFESGKTLTEGWSLDGGKKSSSGETGARPIAKARLLIADQDKTMETKAVDTSAAFTLALKPGSTKLTAQFLDAQGKVLCGAFYVKAKFTK
ncbi:MAG: sulfatase-like hydrolase/transferase, partial [Phycisphaerae bacterium]